MLKITGMKLNCIKCQMCLFPMFIFIAGGSAFSVLISCFFWCKGCNGLIVILWKLFVSGCASLRIENLAPKF